MEGPELKIEEPKTESRIILSMEEDAPNREVGNLEMDIKGLKTQIMGVARALEGLIEIGQKGKEKEIEGLEDQLRQLRRLLELKELRLRLDEPRNVRMGGEMGLNVEVMKAKSSKLVVPANLPKFKQGGYEDPEEFLEAFEQVMEAHEIKEERYVKILKLCLDSIDNQWLEDNEGEWGDVKEGFIGHFKSPHAEIMWLKQIEQLQVGKNSVQRYTDQFMRLMKRVGWEGTNKMAIYQYQKGLPAWMESPMSRAVVGYETSGRGLTVKIISDMALGIEARAKEFRKNPSKKETKEYGSKKTCEYCGWYGHTEDDCYTKRADSRSRREEGSKVVQEKPKTEEKREPVKLKYNRQMGDVKYRVKEEKKTQEEISSKKCYVCGKVGHIAYQCSEKKSVRAISKVDNKQENEKYEESDLSLIHI